ncbi:MAG: DUF4258 domain-containing protein [Tabrizicola sp.]|nr:DUF4258 domain-containing protein [Tabrizicola sp.]
MIRSLALETERIVIVNHARKSQRVRRISRRQIELCVQKGSITEGPFCNAHGNWQVTMYRHAAGEEITCIVAIEWPSQLLVITVY